MVLPSVVAMSRCRELDAKPPLRQALAGNVLQQDGVVAQHEAVALAPEDDGVQVPRHAVVRRLHSADAANDLKVLTDGKFQAVTSSSATSWRSHESCCTGSW